MNHDSSCFFLRMKESVWVKDGFRGEAIQDFDTKKMGKLSQSNRKSLIQGKSIRND